ncbi:MULTISPECIES: hypothetical protein [unclassified Nocardioides]|uniref:hypothetical protein n=1 Tax=unclassified Nocardioides TaxID=2615069 RepID=UPI0010565816|nr:MULTISPECIES: hypothetical protein [unclassified Nocardioides]
MNEPSPTRPRQVTLAAWMIMVGSVVVVAMVFDRIAGLHTMETRESIEKFLAEPPGDDLGVGVKGVISLLRTLSMVAAGCATAAAILGYQVLRRSRSARFALTLLAVPLFLTGMVTGGFVSSVVAASAAMLWLQPSRDWFNGVNRPAPASTRSVAPPSTSAPVPGVPAAAWPAPPVSAPLARPGAVVWACVLTWVFGALTAVAMTVSAIAIAVDQDLLLDEVHRQNPDLREQGVTDGLLVAATYVMAGLIVLWCLAAIVVAVLVWRRVGWARIVLIVSASACIGLSLLGSVLGAFLLVFPLVAGVATVALLVRADARPWFDRTTPTGRQQPGGADRPR